MVFRQVNLSSSRSTRVSTVAAVFLAVMAFAIIGLNVAELPQAGVSRVNENGQARTTSVDPHSFGNLDQVRVRHIVLDLTVDFERRILKGTAVLDLVRQPGCPADTPLVLDSRGLTIEEARSASTGDAGGNLYADNVSA